MAVIHDEIMRLVREIYKRKILIVVTIILMSVIGGIYKYSGAVDESNGTSGKIANEVIKLTPEEQELNEQYVVLDSKIQTQQEYYDNSLLLQYGGYGASIGTMNFSLSNDNNENMELETIQNLYQQYITSEQFSEDVKEELKLDTSGKYVEELISVKQQDESGRSFSVSVLEKDKEQVQLISDAVKKLVLSYKVDEKRNLGSYDIVFINEVFTSDKSYDVDDLKIAKYKEIEANESALQMIQGQLSQEQVMALQNAGIELESEDNVSVTRAGVIVMVLKGLIFGALVGLIVGVLLIIAIYYLSDTIKNRLEWDSSFGVPILEEISLRNIKNKTILTPNGNIVNNIAGLQCKIQYLMKINKINKVTIVCSEEEQYDSVLSTLMHEGLKLEGGVDYDIVRAESRELSETVKASEGAILIIQIGTTKREIVERVINEIEIFDKTIVGALLIN